MRILTDPVPISRIFLDLSNPRHVPFETEDQAIEYLCDKEDIWPLARDITHVGVNPLERVALIAIRGQANAYTMAEGNRRLCALKLLADPDRAPARLRKGFETLAKQRTPPQALAAVVFDNDEEVRPWLERMHNGAFGGRGRRDWNSEQLQRFSGSNKNKIAQGFLDYAVAEGLISEDDRKGKLTTVQRFLGNDVFREAMGLDQTNPDDLARTRPKSEFDVIARRFIRDLIDGTAVNSRMNKPQIIEYARPLGSLPGITATRVEPESLAVPAETEKDSAQPRTRTRRTPRKPEKVRHIQYADEIASALKSYGNHKLESLYHSICAIELETHTPIVCIGVWAFIETLTACAGRNGGTSFNDFLSNTLPANTLMFIDPPYFKKGPELYTNFYKADDHAKLAEKVLEVDLPWVVTYDDVDEIRRLYRDRRQYAFGINYSLNEKRVGAELLIVSKGLRVPADTRDRQVNRPQYRSPELPLCVPA